MPSYLVPARESFVPTQLYQPDFGAVSGLLRIKQMQYDTGFNKMKSMYTSIINAPITNEANQVARQGYMNDAQEQLKNLPKADLSLPQNQAKGESVFDPFYQDQDIVTDMVKTKQFQQQYSYAESLRNSKKPEEQAQYWDMGVQYLNNGMDKLRTAQRGNGSIQAVEPRKYVNFFDSQKYLDEEAKTEGLKIERETSNGQYKLTRINGDAAVPLFETWAKGKLGNNPKASDMFRVEGTVLYENNVKNLTSKGIDYETAKSTLASNYIDRQAQSYSGTVTNLKGFQSKLQTDIEAQKILTNQVPTQENLAKLTSMLDQWDQTNKSIPEYESLANKYKDKKSKEYNDVLNSITNNGEAFFAEHSRDNFITNWSKTRASNSSVKYDIDPGFKLNLELEKEMNRLKAQEEMNDTRVSKTVDGIYYGKGGNPANGQGGSGGTGSGGSGSAAAKQAALDTPIPVGLNIYGKDLVSTFNRFVGAKKEAMDGYVNSGLKFVEQMSFNYGSGDLKTITGAYLSDLKKQMTLGINTNTASAKEEHKQLQAAGIIPQELDYGSGPIRTFNAIKDYYTGVFNKQIAAGTAKPSLVNLLDNEEFNAKRYGELKSIEDKEIATLKADPKFKDIFSGDNVLPYQQYIKAKGADLSDKAIAKDYGYYLAGKRLNPGSSYTMGTDVKGYEEYKSDYIKQIDNRFKPEYDKKIEGFKSEFGKTSLGNGNDEAYIAPGVHFEAGEKTDRTIAKRIATVAMGDENFAQQNITKDGILPANIAQLEELGADRKEVMGLLQRIQHNADDVISGVDVSKIGTDGKPMVKLYIKPSVIDDYSNKDKNQLISQKTANALGKGIEITINNPALLHSQGLNLDFTPSSIDQLTLKREGKVSAPEVLRNAGFDYEITPSVDGRNLLVKFNYKQFKNGTFENKVYTNEVPIDGSSIQDIRTNLFNTSMEVYTGNFNASSQYYKQNPQVSPVDVEGLLKKFNYKQK